MIKEGLALFGGSGMGDCIIQVPLIRELQKDYDVTFFTRGCNIPIISSLGFATRAYSGNNKNFYKDGKDNFHFEKNYAEKLLVNKKWVRPFGIASVYVDGIECPNRLPIVRTTGERNLSLPEKLLHRYTNWEGSPIKFEASRFPSIKDTKFTVAFASSHETLRAIPISVIEAIVAKYRNVRFCLVGSSHEYKENEWSALFEDGANTEIYACPSEHNRAEIIRRAQIIQAADLVISSDCGWAWIAMAAKIPLVWLESRILYEALIPSSYWDKVMFYKPEQIKCGRECKAGRLELGAKEQFPESCRPRYNWAYPKLLPDKMHEIYDAKHGFRNLPCFKEATAPCLTYDSVQIEDLIKICECFVSKLASFRK